MLGIARAHEGAGELRTHTVAILVLALATRLLVFWFALAQFPHNWLYSRGIELGTLAQSLAAGQGLSSPFGGSTGPTALLAPGYPAIIAVLFRIFGSFTFPAAIAVMVMQVLFSVTTVLLIMMVARRCFDRRTAEFGGSVLGGIVAAALDAEDLLGDLLVHAVSGGHDCFGTAL